MGKIQNRVGLNGGILRLILHFAITVLILIGIMTIIDIFRGGFRFRKGGRGADAFLPSGIRPPADPKGPPFDTFSQIHFWPTDLKIFLKAPLAPIYTNFEGERAPKKRDFLPKFFKKIQKRLF